MEDGRAGGDERGREGGMEGGWDGGGKEGRERGWGAPLSGCRGFGCWVLDFAIWVVGFGWWILDSPFLDFGLRGLIFPGLRFGV